MHLKGLELDTGAVVEVEDTAGDWRIEETWPPADVNWTTWFLGSGSLEAEAGQAGSLTIANPGGLIDPEDCAPSAPMRVVPGTELRFAMAPGDEPLRFAGMPLVHVSVTPTDARGGHLYAELLSQAPDGATQRLIHGTMDLRFHAGGEQPQDIEPMQPITARMQLYPMDAVVPAGHALVLRLVADSSIEPCAAATGQDYIQRPSIPAGSAPLQVHWGPDSRILLPIVQRDVEGSYPGQPD